MPKAGYKPAPVYPKKLCPNCEEMFRPASYKQNYCCTECGREGRRPEVLYVRRLSVRLYRFLAKDPGRLQALIDEMDSNSGKAEPAAQVKYNVEIKTEEAWPQV